MLLKHFHYFLIIKIDYNCQVANIFGVLEVHEVSFYSQTDQNLGSGEKSLSTVLQNLSPFIYPNGIIPPFLLQEFVNMHVIAQAQILSMYLGIIMEKWYTVFPNHAVTTIHLKRENSKSSTSLAYNQRRPTCAQELVGTTS